MAAHQVRALLMGGQACVFYGAAEFSRDTDLAVLADAANWERLQAALADLKAESIAVPPATLEYLQRGFAIHFRCHHQDAEEMRVDVMSVMRGVDEFGKLWERRLEIQDKSGTIYQLVALSDLVRAKKTQRSKDWPMIQRLVEADYFEHKDQPDQARIKFWLRESRTPSALLEIAKRNPRVAREFVAIRPLLEHALENRVEELAAALETEEKEEREKDRIYWQPLKQELERLRHNR